MACCQPSASGFVWAGVWSRVTQRALLTWKSTDKWELFENFRSSSPWFHGRLCMQEQGGRGKENEVGGGKGGARESPCRHPNKSGLFWCSAYTESELLHCSVTVLQRCTSSTVELQWIFLEVASYCIFISFYPSCATLVLFFWTGCVPNRCTESRGWICHRWIGGEQQAVAWCTERGGKKRTGRGDGHMVCTVVLTCNLRF